MLCSDNSPIAGKHMVLIGTLLGLDRQDSVAFLSQLGANVQSQINLQTQYIIQGTIDQTPKDADDSDSDQLEQGETGGMAGVARALAGISSRRKMEIESRGLQGQSLTILSQRQLLAMLPSGLEVVRGQER
jgi:hypothetical protein